MQFKKLILDTQGMPMGMADIATVLFKDHLKFDPSDPSWIDRDRLIISNGHGSMLLYAALYLNWLQRYFFGRL